VYAHRKNSASAASILCAHFGQINVNIFLAFNFKTLKAIATYQRVSTEEQARDTEAFVRQGWQLDREAAKFSGRTRLHFSDVQSGRRDDRPDMLRLIRAIETEQIDVLIVTRIDRIGRDLESNSRLQKLLQSKDVRVYEDMLGRFLDFLNPNDWRYFAQAGLDSEGESRMLSARIKKTFEWHRSQKKIGGGMIGFPYLRNKQGYIEPHPDNWQLAVKCIKIIVANGGTNLNAFKGIQQLGIDRSRAWLSKWIRSPLIRGHSPINTCDRNRRRKHLNDIELFSNSHLSLFDDPQLIGTQRIVDQIIEDAKRYKGRVGKNHPVQALSGLIFCGRCGKSCYIRLSGSPRYPTKDRRYAVCSQRILKASSCGSNLEYGAFDGTRKIINTLYSTIEHQVICTLASKASELIDLTIAEVPTTTVDPPEVVELRSQIARLNNLNDPDLEDTIYKKTNRLNKLLLTEATPSFSAQTRADFVHAFSQPHTVMLLSEQQRRVLYRDWIRKVVVDRDRIELFLVI